MITIPIYLWLVLCACYGATLMFLFLYVLGSIAARVSKRLCEPVERPWADIIEKIKTEAEARDAERAKRAAK